jgi:hypothetical protein
METLGIYIRGVLQFRSERRDQDEFQDRPLTPHIIMSVAQEADITKARSLAALCGLRVSVKTYVAPKDPTQCRRCQSF